MTKKFCIWDKDGKSETYSADRAEFQKRGDGLKITLHNKGQKKQVLKGCIALVEASEPVRSPDKDKKNVQVPG